MMMLKLQALFQLRNSASLYVFNLIINLMQFSSCVNVSQRLNNDITDEIFIRVFILNVWTNPTDRIRFAP